MRILVAVAAIAALTSPVAAQVLALEEVLGTQGGLKYCRYSDGNIYTVNSYETCPQTIGFGDYGSHNSGQATGRLIGTYPDGLSTVCVYDVYGEEHAMRLQGAYRSCPYSHRF